MRDYFLTSQRIGFSHWSPNDLDLALSLWRNDKVSHYICAKGIFTDTEVKTRLNIEIENMKLYSIQYFPIFQLETNTFMGCCGLRPSIQNNVYELGIHLKPEFWKQGFAYEAAKAIIDYSFSTLQIKELRAGHHPHNISSKKLLHKLGFEYIQDKYYEPTGLFHPDYSLKQ